MAVIAIFALVAIAIAAGAYFQYRAKQQRILALRSLAAQRGFDFFPDDINGLVALPFALFGRGDGRKVENVMRGKDGGRPVQLFDYWYYDESTDSKGHRSRTYHRFTCGLVTVEAQVPHLSIGRENFLTRLGNHFGMHDVEFESEAFNQEFRVHCNDQRFAFSLVDARMMEWLPTARDFSDLEFMGPFVLVAAKKLTAPEWPALLDFLRDFHDHVPNVVFTTYPPSR